jgi:uncharacterized protein (DUF433 family)
MALLDWSQCPAVESIPGKVSGTWVLRNTRMPVATIFENLEAGANIDDILAWYDGLDRDQVKAVIEFAARSLDTPVASWMRVLFDPATPVPIREFLIGHTVRTAAQAHWRTATC